MALKSHEFGVYGFSPCGYIFFFSNLRCIMYDKRERSERKEVMWSKAKYWQEAGGQAKRWSVLCCVVLLVVACKKWISFNHYSCLHSSNILPISQTSLFPIRDEPGPVTLFNTSTAFPPLFGFLSQAHQDILFCYSDTFFKLYTASLRCISSLHPSKFTSTGNMPESEASEEFTLDVGISIHPVQCLYLFNVLTLLCRTLSLTSTVSKLMVGVFAGKVKCAGAYQWSCRYKCSRYHET